MTDAIDAESIAAQRPYLLRLAFRRLRNRERSEDAVQGVLLAALAGADGYRSEAALRTWLTAILRNRLVDEYRAQAREPLLLDLARDVREAGHLEHAPGPEAEVEMRRLAQRLAATVRSLPEASAQAFVLRDLEGASMLEVQRRLGLTAAQLWTRLHRARLALRRAAGNNSTAQART